MSPFGNGGLCTLLLGVFLFGDDGLHTRFLGVGGVFPCGSKDSLALLLGVDGGSFPVNESLHICLLGVDGGSPFGCEGLLTLFRGVDGVPLVGNGGNSSRLASCTDDSVQWDLDDRVFLATH